MASTNNDYYNFMNLESYLDKLGIVYPADWLRWCKDIINTKMGMFHYDGLPEGLTSQILEGSLMFRNFLCFYNSPTYGIVLCTYRCGSDFDIYWKPKYVNLLSISGITIGYHVPYKDIVLVRDNIMDIIPFLTLNGWIDKIMELERTLEIQVELARMPTILTGDKEQANMLKSAIKKAANYEAFILATKGFKDHMEQFDIKYPVQPKDVYELMEKYKNLALASMGIYSVDQKRERIVTAEVQATNDYVDFVYTGMYNERVRWVQEANDKLGLNIVMHEAYVENELDNIELSKKQAMAQAKAEIEVEKVKNEGKVEAAKVEGIDAAKLEPKEGGDKQ